LRIEARIEKGLFMTPTELVMQFCEAWERLDWPAIVDMLAEDIYYHNIPMDPCVGRAASKAFFEGMGHITSARFEVHAIATNGAVVLTERTDHFTINGKHVSLPVMGTFEIENDKIQKWRDYFDLATFMRQVSS
jgi:limonene-1,2-epoxide hydrolase